MFRRFSELKEKLAGPPARRTAYYSLVQTAYACLAGSFEMPMALRLAGRLEYLALVYSFYYTMLLGGFGCGLILAREGRASLVFRLQIGILAALCLGAAALYGALTGVLALGCYFSLRGFAEGLFWAGRHRAFLWAVRDAGRDDFSLRLQSASTMVSVILPLMAGAAISFLRPALGAKNPLLPSGYVPVFLVTGLVLILALLGSPDFRIGRSPLSFARIASLRSLPAAASWRAFLSLGALSGLAVGLGGGILTFALLKTEFRIGALNALIALLSSGFFALVRRRFAGRQELRRGGVLAGATADCLSRLGYALAPTAGGLALKTLLDAFAVPLKSLFGENIQRAHIEGLSEASGASAAELFFYQEYRFWLARFGGSCLLGLGLALVGAGGAQVLVRLLIGLAAPLALLEYAFLRSFAFGAEKRAEARRRGSGLPASD